MSPQYPRTHRFGVRRSVFLTQLVMAVCVLTLVVILLIVDIDVVSEISFFLGVTLVFALTALAATIDWERVPSWTIGVIPVLDIIAVTLMRLNQPTITVALFYAFPVIWLASYFRRWGAVLGPSLASVLYIVLIVSETSKFSAVDLPRTLVLPITFAFVATAIYQSRTRAQAQRVILDRQSGLLEAALERSRRGEKLLDEVLNAVRFGVVRMDENGRAVFTNDAHRLWMRSHDQPEWRLGAEHLYAADGRTLIPEEERPFARAARGESFRDVVVWMGDPDAEERLAFAITGHRLDGADGDVSGSVVVSRDITTELQAVKARDDLMASVTHELKNPLTSVTGFVELAVDAPELSETTRHQLEVVLKSSDRMLGLVTDLLEASRAAAVGLKLTKAEMDLADVARDAVEAARPSAGSVDVRCDVVEPALMVGDAFRLRQVLDNLVSNAIKYNRPQGSVVVRIAEDGECLELTVTDTGQGLTADEVDAVFARYYRAPSAGSVGGTGLGLNISRDIVRQHDGDITVTSEPGLGSTFTVRLPRAMAQLEEQR
ncbi:PAS fold-containing protein [Paramicrobacterium humi]|uniref:histidine kinase n=1 Tax=Paramicrobacterium humi TaxID=640635 RepID=A0A1H4NAU3_9MICO|nr:PAS domain-containing sensor histidine kinase [Microbacterium humi]SEB92359.1 PAS fold-containing protein [Microbacterium humi]